MPPDQLFLERCLQLLRPGGRLAIVLPDSILSNPGPMLVRQWLLQRARLLASIDLPQVTFEPHTGTQTSLLLLQKKTEDEIAVELEMGKPRDYEVFMALPRQVGHDRRGEVLYRRTPEGQLIEREEVEPIRRVGSSGQIVIEHRRRRRRQKDDELPDVTHAFQEWINDRERKAWVNV